MKKQTLIPAAIATIALALTSAPFVSAQNAIPASPPMVANDMKASVAFDSASAIEKLESATFESRMQTVGEIQANVDATTEKVTQSQTKASVNGSASSEVSTAINDVAAARSELRLKISSLTYSTASTFETDRAALIEALKVYGEATTSLEAAINEG